MHSIVKKYLAKQAKGAVMDGLNMGIIKKLPVPLPPIELQHRYSKIYDCVNKAKIDLKNSTDMDSSLFSSLTQRAFKGELTQTKVTEDENSDGVQLQFSF